MRGIPRARGFVVAQSLPIVVAEHDGALGGARVIFASAVLAQRESGAVRLRAGQNVVPVRLVAAAVDYLTFFREVVLLVELVIGAVQVGDACGDNDTFGVHPRTLADAVARIHGVRTLRGQVGVPRLTARADRGGKFLAMAIGAGKSAEIAAFTRSVAGHKEAHVRLLRSRRRAQRQARRERNADLA